MRSINFKKYIGIYSLSIAAVLGMSVAASAQNGRDNNGSWRNNGRQERPANDRDRNGDRYRIGFNGSFYNTDRRGAEMLRQAVRAGYQAGFRAGVADASRRGRNRWDSSPDYRSADFGFQHGVDRGQYQRYFRMGFEQGYKAGISSRNHGVFTSGRVQNRHDTRDMQDMQEPDIDQMIDIQQY